MQLFLIWSTLILTVFVNLFLLYIVNHKSAEKKIVHTFFSLHIASIVGWALLIISILLLPQITGKNHFVAGDIGYRIEKGIFLFGALLLSTNFWFAYVFVHKRLKLTIFTGIVFLFQLSVLLLCLIDNVFYTSVTIDPAGYALLELAPLNSVYALFLLLHLVIPIGILHLGRRRTEDKQYKRQSTALILSYAFFLFISILLNWILPVYFSIFTFNALGPTISLFLVAGITYTILRHDFLDIRFVIQRGFVYTILLTFIVSVYVVMLNVTDLFFEQQFTFADFVTGLITTIVGVLTVPRLDIYLRRKTDRWFFKDRYEYNQVLYELTQTLQSSLELDTLLQISEQTLTKILRAERVSVVPKSLTPVLGAGEEMVPIKLQKKLTGYIILGPKRSGDSYNDEDRQLLETFAAQAATAMSRAFLYQEVKRYASELEQKVTDRTAEVTALQEQQKEMMLHISHELQTPLAVLQTQLDEMRSSLQDQSTVTPLERTLRRVSQFIKDLLRLSRLEQQATEVDKSLVAVDQVLEEAIEEIGVIATGKDISIRQEMQSGVTHHLNQRDLHEIIMNLASNAIKYRKSSGRQEISFTLKDTEDTVVLKVADRGIGISAEDFKHIFSRFYRAAKDGGQTGTGLGLAITKQLVERNGGSIAVSSVLGDGTTFTVTFPK